MDMMEARRRLLMQKGGIDTSPIIAYYDKTLSSGNLVDSQNGSCVTKIYTYTPSATQRSVKASNTAGQCAIYTDGVYTDWWRNGNYKLNANSNGIAVTLRVDLLDNCYCYIEGSGEILFAGKNTIYYGHRNIGELS